MRVPRFTAAVLAAATASATVLAMPASATEVTNTVALNCAVDASIGGKFDHNTDVSVMVDARSHLTAGQQTTARIKLSDVVIEHDQVGRLSSASMSNSAVRVAVGGDVELVGSPAGVTLQDGILTFTNKLKVTKSGNQIIISAPEQRVNLRAKTDTDVAFTTVKDTVSGTVVGGVAFFSVNVQAECSTTPGQRLNQTEDPAGDTPETPVDTGEAVQLTVANHVDAAAEAVTATANVGQREGHVQFFVNNRPAGEPVAVVGGTATAELPLPTAGTYSVVARYVDGNNKNPIEDATAQVFKPLPTESRTNGKAVDADSYSGTINGQTTSHEAPLVVNPGDVVTVLGTMSTPLGNRMFEFGLNPPAGVEYVADSGKFTSGGSTVTTRGNEFTGASGYRNPQWGVEPNPAVNPGYVGLHSTSSYTVWGGNRTIEAQFQIPEGLAPGIYQFEFGSHKYTSGLNAIVPLPGTTFEIKDPNPAELPPRDIPEEKEEDPNGAGGTGSWPNWWPGSPSLPGFPWWPDSPRLPESPAWPDSPRLPDSPGFPSPGSPSLK